MSTCMTLAFWKTDKMDGSREARLDFLMYAMEIHTLWTYLGIKLIEIYIVEPYNM